MAYEMHTKEMSKGKMPMAKKMTKGKMPMSASSHMEGQKMTNSENHPWSATQGRGMKVGEVKINTHTTRNFSSTPMKKNTTDKVGAMSHKPNLTTTRSKKY